jgi:hypothetical protein
MPIKKFGEWCKDLMELADPDGYVPSTVFQAKQGIQGDVSKLGVVGATAKRILTDALAALDPRELTIIITKMKSMLSESNPRENEIKKRLVTALANYRRAIMRTKLSDEPIEDTSEEEEDGQDDTSSGFDLR